MQLKADQKHVKSLKSSNSAHNFNIHLSSKRKIPKYTSGNTTNLVSFPNFEFQTWLFSNLTSYLKTFHFSR